MKILGLLLIAPMVILLLLGNYKLIEHRDDPYSYMYLSMVVAFDIAALILMTMGGVVLLLK